MNRTDRLDQKTILIPYMCDHVYALGAALTAHGIPHHVLPRTTDESLDLGLDSAGGKECLPCLASTGDVIRFMRNSDIDPGSAVVLIPTASGPCRLGQYRTLQRQILDRHGYGELDILSPSGSNSYRGFGARPVQLRALAWQGFLAVDTLQKLLHAHRPYEAHSGQTDRLYANVLERVLIALRDGGGKALYRTMELIGRRFEELPQDRGEQRPLIGLVGEFYLRFNEYSNQQVIRKLEKGGAEVVLASFVEWIYFTNWAVKCYAWYHNMFKELAGITLTDIYQRRVERNIIGPVEHLLPYPAETPISTLMQHIVPYYEPFLGTEAVLSMGKAIDYAQHGLAGIVNVMPFTCMPGIVVAGMAPFISRDLDNIPWLDVAYDGQGGTNLNTRLEAFIFQAQQFTRRHPA